jgi:hypothetical protein
MNINENSQPNSQQAPSSNQETSAVDEEVKKPFKKAYDDYVQAYTEALFPIDVRKPLEEAYYKYMRALQELSPLPESSSKLLEAYCAYVQALQGLLALKRQREHFEEIYKNYVRALKDAWANVNVDTLHARIMHEIGNSMIAVAYYARSI